MFVRPLVFLGVWTDGRRFNNKTARFCGPKPIRACSEQETLRFGRSKNATLGHLSVPGMGSKNRPVERLRSLFGRSLQFLARILQVVPRQFEVRFEPQCLLTSSGRFLVATELIVSGA